jgi:hypothetical protein
MFAHATLSIGVDEFHALSELHLGYLDSFTKFVGSGRSFYNQNLAKEQLALRLNLVHAQL